MSDLAQMIDGACYVYRDEDRGLTVVWNGSATFNVYLDTHDPRDFDPVDCFTRYASDGGYGPGDSEGLRWAKECILDWLVTTLSDEDI